MNKCYAVQWNSYEGEPELVEVFKNFDAALCHCVNAIEEAKQAEEELADKGVTYSISVEVCKHEPQAHWIELIRDQVETEMAGVIKSHPRRVIEWYKVTEMEFADA